MDECDVPIVGEICDAVGQIGAAAVAAPFDWLADSMGRAAAWLFNVGR